MDNKNTKIIIVDENIALLFRPKENRSFFGNTLVRRVGCETFISGKAS